MSTEAAEFKRKGNEYFKQKKWDLAIKEYSEAISLDPKGSTSHTYYSNRSACFAGKGEYSRALSDGEQCIKLKPDWGKGYSRKGLALFKLGRLDEAKSCYEEGLKVDPTNNSLKNGLEETNKTIEEQKKGPSKKGLFGPEIWMTIHQHPELKEYAKDQSFVQKVNMLQQNPQLAMQMGLLNDPKIQKLFSVAMGINFSTNPEDVKKEDNDSNNNNKNDDNDDNGNDIYNDDDVTMNEKKTKDGDVEITNDDKRNINNDDSNNDIKDEETEEEKQEREEKERIKKIKQEAEKLKEEGNKEYKEKNFEKALELYKKAFEKDNKNPAYLLNQSAVYFMQQKWDDTMKLCNQAIELANEIFADSIWAFKAYLRMGSVEEKRKNLQKAIVLYKKALVEKKDPKLRKRIKLLENKKKKMDEKAYLNPELAIDHKNKGNEFFKNGKFVEAVKEYTESIKRNPKDPIVYNNRATAYCKLMTWNAALEDAKKAHELDPNFIKPLIRMGKIYHVLKQYHKCIKVYNLAKKIDENNIDLINARNLTQKAVQQRNQSGEIDEIAKNRALSDPEVKSYMNDPEVSSVLLQAKNDPTVLWKAMQTTPRIAEKIEYLMYAGVLQMR